MKIRLGTANFGRIYGIDAKNIVTDFEIRRILENAQKLGILSIDTAQDYGDSEISLGANLSKNAEWDICTKIRITPENETEIERVVRKSKHNLGGRKLNTILIHNVFQCNNLDLDNIVNQFIQLQEQGEIDNFGISAYELTEIQYYKTKYPKMNFFQVPDNICSRNLLDNSYLLGLKENNNKIDVRSIFLQGILLNSKIAELNQNPQLKKYIESFAKYVEKINIPAIEICVQYAKNLKWADSIVVGVRSLEEINKINNIFLESTFNIEIYPEKIPAKISDPRKWNIISE